MLTSNDFLNANTGVFDPRVCVFIATTVVNSLI